jgi:hypothetical protein
MDSLLAGNLILPLEGSLCRYDVQRHCACRKHSGHRESHSGLGRILFAFAPESLFAFSPESRSPSPRNPFHVHPGILFAFARNPHSHIPAIVIAWRGWYERASHGFIFSIKIEKVPTYANYAEM